MSKRSACVCEKKSIFKHVYIINELKSSRVYIAVCMKRRNWQKLLFSTPDPLSKWLYHAINEYLMNYLLEDLVLHVSNKFITYLAWKFQMIIWNFSLRSLCLLIKLVSRINCLIYLIWLSQGSSVWWLVKRYYLTNDIWSKLTDVQWV